MDRQLIVNRWFSDRNQIWVFKNWNQNWNYNFILFWNPIPFTRVKVEAELEPI
jgi:hypothetical protein